MGDDLMSGARSRTLRRRRRGNWSALEFALNAVWPREGDPREGDQRRRQKRGMISQIRR